MRYANLLIETYSILICFCLGYHLYFHRNTMRRQKNWFIIMLTANVAMTLADMTDWIFSYRITPYTVLILNIGMVIYFVCSGVLMVSYSYYLLACITAAQQKESAEKRSAVSCQLYYSPCIGGSPAGNFL